MMLFHGVEGLADGRFCCIVEPGCRSFDGHFAPIEAAKQVVAWGEVLIGAGQMPITGDAQGYLVGR